MPEPRATRERIIPPKRLASSDPRLGHCILYRFSRRRAPVTSRLLLARSSRRYERLGKRTRKPAAVPARQITVTARNMAA